MIKKEYDNGSVEFIMSKDEWNGITREDWAMGFAATIDRAEADGTMESIISSIKKIDDILSKEQKEKELITDQVNAPEAAE